MGDKDANFDGIRVDAVDNVDADTFNSTQTTSVSTYGVNKSEANVCFTSQSLKHGVLMTTTTMTRQMALRLLWKKTTFGSPLLIG